MVWKNDQVSEEETLKIIRLAKESLEIPGDFVELGCYKGDTSLILAEVLRDYNRDNAVENSVDKSVEKYVEKPVKKLWIYDSFEGLPEKSSEDESVLGINFKGGELYATKREVKERLLRAGLPVPVIQKGWFSELHAEDLPEQISFAFLDGDFYESIKDSLRLVTPRMSEGGTIVVHDYSNPALPGAKKAVDEWKFDGAVNLVLL